MTTLKYMLGMLAVAVVCAYFYNMLEKHLGDTWLTVGIFAIVLISLRAGLYFYRKSKGIKDTWPND
ncbi:hypothetical protein SAMN05216593_1343 [Pseudomonas asturiensis]|uniref:Uncharacterized protein n=1 Tax=Pseudomonas asturiensis TaxID=1190415 RepID=A0A1M7QKV1_9PSED|nr:hypothetical protein [Pseudomonas asturiensis]SHN31572.1 hypothetical protein SAMN05216593_1343 [Pseudomonas asturiensis]